MRITRIAAIVAFLAACALPTDAAQISLPTTLDALLADDAFIAVGGVTISAFDYNSTGAGMPAASQISVADNGGRLVFGAPFFDLPGGSGNGASDSQLSFSVSGSGITGVKLSGNPSLGQTGTGIAEIVETIFDSGLSGQTDKLQLAINHTFVNNGPINVEDSTTFSVPLNSFRVVKDILLLSTGPGVTNAATLSIIEQEFVPEPTGLALLVVGLATGLGMTRRRH